MSVRKGFLLVIASLFFVCSSTWAQQSSTRTVKRNVATVLFSTLGGAILGLSTLPFYGEPQEHTDNISLGALVGFVAGTGYVAYNVTQPEVAAPKNDYGFGESLQNKKTLAVSAKAFPLVQFNFEF
jgi:drug/metabolite transporter (DMT)-like permease